MVRVLSSSVVDHRVDPLTAHETRDYYIDIYCLSDKERW